MAVTRIPTTESKNWTQPNLGDLLGVLWATYNVDLTMDRGIVQLSGTTRGLKDNSDDADLEYPSAFIRSEADTTDRWWAVTNNVLFKTVNSSAGSTWSQDANTNSPTDLSHLYSDIVEHEGRLVVSKSDSLDLLPDATTTWTNDWWTDAGELNQTALTLVEHPLDVYNRLLLIGDGNELHTIDRDDVVEAGRITLPDQYVIRCIVHNKNRIWIGTRNILDGNAAIFEWDGSSETYNNMFSVDARIVLAMIVKDEVPYCIESNGYIRKYNGYSFIEAENGRLPISNLDFYQDGTSLTGAYWQDSWTNEFMVHWNGMEVINNKINVLLSGAISGTNTNLIQNMLGGIWEYEPSIGFYHKHALRNHNTGTPTEYGNPAIYKTGAIKSTHDSYIALVGVTIYSNNTPSYVHSIQYIDPLATFEQRGFIITTRIETSSIKENFEKIWLKFRELENSNDKIIVKYRTGNTEGYNLPMRAGITWTSTTTFTSTDSNFSNVSVGDEVFVIIGSGAGSSAHISSKSESSGTYTITLDEAITGTVTGTGQVIVTNFQKLTNITQQTKEYDERAIDDNDSTWIQFKVELRNESSRKKLKLSEMILYSTPSIQIND